jgi:hypothetical protein
VQDDGGPVVAEEVRELARVSLTRLATAAEQARLDADGERVAERHEVQGPWVVAVVAAAGGEDEGAEHGQGGRRAGGRSSARGRA